MKKIFAILLSITLVFTFVIPAFAHSESTEAEPLRFNDDGKFKILHLTDLHMHDEQDNTQNMSELLIKKMVISEAPDVVMITGDIAMNSTVERTRENINTLMSLFDELKIPVAVTFGNHDSESGLISREALLSIYMQYDCCIAVDDADILPGAGTYNIPILSSDGKKIAFNLWAIDSGEYDEENHYASTDPAIIQWYVDKSNALKAQNSGECVNSLVFQHIIVPEIYDALKKTTRLNAYAVKHIYNNDCYVLDSSNTNAGRLREYPCPGYYNNGQFDAVVNQGDVLAMFFGHDHSNTFNVEYKGIDLIATPKAQFEGLPDCIKGGRVITLDESDTSTYETHVVTFASLYKCSDLSALENAFELKTASTVCFYNGLWNILDFIATKIGELFTFSKIDFD